MNSTASGNKGSRRKGEQIVFVKGEEIEITFVNHRFNDGVEKVVSFLEDGTIVYPGKDRFIPTPGKPYLCAVQFREVKGTNRKTGQAVPVIPHIACTPSEWLPDREAERIVRIEELTFTLSARRDGKGREAMAKTSDGQIVFPMRGTEVSIGHPRRYILKRHHTVRLAVALPEDTGDGKAMIRAAEAAGEWSTDDLKYIVVNGAYRSVYDILGVPSDASESQIKTAARAKSKKLHPDLIAQQYRERSGGKEPSAQVMATAEGYFRAITEAQNKALEILDRAEAKDKGTTASQPSSEPVATESTPVEDTVAAPEPTAPSAPDTTSDGDPIVDGTVYGHSLEQWNAMGDNLKGFYRKEARATSATAPAQGSKQVQSKRERPTSGTLADQLTAKGLVPSGTTDGTES